MNTDDLIALLATGDTAVPQHAVARRLALAIVLGGLAALVLLVSFYGLRPDLATVSRTPLFWAKLALPASLAVIGGWLCSRLARPGVTARLAWASSGIPLLGVWLGALLTLASVPTASRAALLLGTTWRSCPFNILLLSVPLGIAVCLALRSLAPTRPRQAGAAGGLLAGACATLEYCLHCPEMAVPFWATWYLLGMLLPTLLGALLGPRLLRW